MAVLTGLAIPATGVSQDASANSGSPAVSADALKAVSAAAKTPPSAAIAGATATGETHPEWEFPGKTDLDDPGAKDPRMLVPVDAEGKATVSRLSKIDLDADLDYDGTLDNDLSSDQGALEFVPPGLELGVKEVTRALVRFKTYEREFPGDLVVALEVSPVNRDSASGAFAGNAKSAVGRIRVWRDQARKDLLLDSNDESKRRFEWRYDKEKRFGGIPRTLYVEGVEVSPKFEGDLRLLLSSSHGAGGGSSAPSSLYQTAFDHVLVTVRAKPVEKEFINNNAEGVWSSVGAPAPAGAAPDGAAPDGADKKAEAAKGSPAAL